MKLGVEEGDRVRRRAHEERKEKEQSIFCVIDGIGG
jgi:hypothetical protein